MMESTGRQRIRSLRKFLKKSQKEFAEDVSYGQSHLSRLENGQGPVTYDLIASCVKTYNVSPYWMIGIAGTDETPIFNDSDSIVPKSAYDELQQKYYRLLDEAFTNKTSSQGKLAES